jgi:hypothetical protein
MRRWRHCRSSVCPLFSRLNVCQAIYPEELEIISTSPHNFLMKLVPFPGQDSNNHGSSSSLITTLFLLSLTSSPVAIELNCRFPAQYPAESPNIEIEIKKGLAAKRKEEIMAIIEQVGQENLGTPAIYTIVEAIREWLADNNVAGQVCLYDTLSLPSLSLICLLPLFLSVSPSLSLSVAEGRLHVLGYDETNATKRC